MDNTHSSETYLPYQSFQDQVAAEELTHWLDQAGIPYRTEVYTSGLDASFLGAGAQQDIRVQLRSQDFDRVEAEMKRQAEAAFDQLPLSHYLFAFSNEELQAVLQEKDQWHPRDFYFAQMILAQRGTLLTSTEIADMQANRNAELRKPISYNRYIILGAWIVSFIPAPFLTAIGPIYLGIYLQTHSQKDNHGKRYLVFDAASRRAGRRLVIGNMILQSLYVTVFLYLYIRGF